MSPLLSASQARTLRDVRDYRPVKVNIPYHGFFTTPTYRSLIKRGLIERVDYQSGAYTIYCCIITDAGKMALQECGQ